MRRRRSSFRKEKAIMLASSCLVLGALTVTGLYVRNLGEEEPEENVVDFTALEDEEEECLAEASFIPEEGDWNRFVCTLTAAKTTDKAKLVMFAMEPVTIAFDMVSLFPVDTFRGRENGLRKDIAQLIADMKPKFMRFPGGCLTHMGSLNSRDRSAMYRWKNTLGPVENRPARSKSEAKRS